MSENKINYVFCNNSKSKLDEKLKSCIFLELEKDIGIPNCNECIFLNPKKIKYQSNGSIFLCEKKKILKIQYQLVRKLKLMMRMHIRKLQKYQKIIIYLLKNYKYMYNYIYKYLKISSTISAINRH